MRHTGIDRMDGFVFTANFDIDVQFKVFRIRKPHFHPSTIRKYFRMDNTCQGFKAVFCGGDLIFNCEAGRTATAVGAHFSLSAISVEKPPAIVSRLRSLDQDDTVRAYRHAPPTHLGDKKPHFFLRGQGPSIIDNDEIVSAAAQLPEGNGCFLFHKDSPSFLSEPSVSVMRFIRAKSDCTSSFSMRWSSRILWKYVLTRSKSLSSSPPACAST